MRLAGIDIGSRTIELVVLEDREIVEMKQASGFPVRPYDTGLRMIHRGGRRVRNFGDGRSYKGLNDKYFSERLPIRMRE